MSEASLSGLHCLGAQPQGARMPRASYLCLTRVDLTDYPQVARWVRAPPSLSLEQNSAWAQHIGEPKQTALRRPLLLEGGSLVNLRNQTLEGVRTPYSSASQQVLEAMVPEVGAHYSGSRKPSTSASSGLYAPPGAAAGTEDAPPPAPPGTPAAGVGRRPAAGRAGGGMSPATTLKSSTLKYLAMTDFPSNFLPCRRSLARADPPRSLNSTKILPTCSSCGRAGCPARGRGTGIMHRTTPPHFAHSSTVSSLISRTAVGSARSESVTMFSRERTVVGASLSTGDLAAAGRSMPRRPAARFGICGAKGST
mmetsp:Transcript_4628/g.10165  ORF Transcript_4628/g.10165 Transcript_4628/m.10165 type:complete len:309 (+) Transcript_4628:42-968(+)